MPASTRALVVGISDYGRLNQPLPGCANDMLDWRDTLVALGVRPDAIRLLSDARATKPELLDRFNWLFAENETVDHRVFIFAGHGARLRRRDSDTGDLDDNLDEALVLYPGEEGDIDSFLLYDDDLQQVVSGSKLPPTTQVSVVLDSCHSGGMERDILLKFAKIADDQPVPRCWTPPIDIRHRELAVGDQAAVRRFGTAMRDGEGESRHLIVAAARPEESAWDARLDDGQRHGVFSYHMTRALRGSPVEPCSALLSKVSPLVSSRFPQHPLLLGNRDRFGRPLF